MKSIKVKKIGIKKKDGYLYFIDRDGDISMVQMNQGRKPVKKKGKKAVKKKAVKKKAKKPAKKR